MNIVMPAPAGLQHPRFARWYLTLSAKADDRGAREHRARLLAGLAGRVIEIGAGNGLNFAHYPATVTEVVAIEPEPYLRAQASQAAAQAQVPVTVLDGTAEAVSLADGSMDAGVASLVLCSVVDQAAVLAELHRVIRPGGELRFYEHILADDPRLARRQRRADHIWPWFMGGCHIARTTKTAILVAGFEIFDCDQFLFPPCWIARLSAPHVLGRARRP